MRGTRTGRAGTMILADTVGYHRGGKPEAGHRRILITFTFTSGTPMTERRLRVFSPDAYVSLDYQKKYGIVARKTKNLAAIRDAVARARAGEIEDMSQLNFAELVNVEELQIDDTEPLRAELDSFVDAIRNGTPPEVPAEDGLAAVECATRIVEAIQHQKLD